jgi:hypothetical protein
MEVRKPDLQIRRSPRRALFRSCAAAFAALLVSIAGA